MSSFSVKNNGAWVESEKVYVKDNGSWHEAKNIYVKNNGAWNEVDLGGAIVTPPIPTFDFSTTIVVGKDQNEDLLGYTNFGTGLMVTQPSDRTMNEVYVTKDFLGNSSARFSWFNEINIGSTLEVYIDDTFYLDTTVVEWVNNIARSVNDSGFSADAMYNYLSSKLLQQITFGFKIK